MVVTVEGCKVALLAAFTSQCKRVHTNRKA